MKEKKRGGKTRLMEIHPFVAFWRETLPGGGFSISCKVDTSRDLETAMAVGARIIAGSPAGEHSAEIVEAACAFLGAIAGPGAMTKPLVTVGRGGNGIA